ncbi:hypothetical protein PM082_021122 [Marasmius tenuissimus]|nr:hypothetical protein PM082_021122 [Marasmius tenuissimus]
MTRLCRFQGPNLHAPENDSLSSGGSFHLLGCTGAHSFVVVQENLNRRRRRIRGRGQASIQEYVNYERGNEEIDQDNNVEGIQEA